MSRRYRNSEMRRRVDHRGAGCLGTEAANGAQLGDARAHGVDDAPAAEQRPERNGGIRSDLDPGRNVIEVLDIQMMEESRLTGEVLLRADEQSHDDPHGLLRIVATVGE